MYFDSENVLGNKLIILYAISQFKLPVNKEQISQIVLENIQMSYFDIQFLIDSLLKDHFLVCSKDKDLEYYAITSEGKETLDLFSDRIPQYLKELLTIFIKSNKDKILKQVRTPSEISLNKDGEYDVSLKLLENDISLINITLNVPTKKEAHYVCENWEKKGELLYTEVMNTLIKRN